MEASQETFLIIRKWRSNTGGAVIGRSVEDGPVIRGLSSENPAPATNAIPNHLYELAANSVR